MNILITSASRKVSLVETFKEALAKEGGRKVITADMSPFSAAFYFGDKYYLVPPSTSNLFIPSIIKICKKNNIEMVIPTRDEELPLFSKKKEDFASMGVKVIVPELSTVELCQDKKKFIDFCQSNGFATPKTFKEEMISEDISYPLFLKTRFGKSSNYTFKVTSKGMLESLLNLIEEPIIQEYLKTREYSIDLFSDFEGNPISVVPRERVSIFGGESFIGITRKNKKLINKAIRLAKALKLTGPNTIQCFYDGRDAKYIEVNPRFGGGVNLSIAAGATIPLYLIQVFKGKRATSRIGNFKDGYVMMRYTEDKFLEESRLTKVTSVD